LSVIGDFRACRENVLARDPPAKTEAQLGDRIDEVQTQAPICGFPARKLELGRRNPRNLDGDCRLALEPGVSLRKQGKALILIRLRLPPPERYRAAEILKIDPVGQPIADVQQTRDSAERKQQGDAISVEADDLRSWRYV
jgi:hypothetical protein